MDLLAHPNVKLFVSQAGRQSCEEAMVRMVPTVAIPFIGDQVSNAAMLEKLGVGKKILPKELTVQRLRDTIFEVVQNPRFKENVEQVAREVRDTPMNATETAVWYIEHAIRNRGSSMFRYRGKQMSVYEFYFFDVLSFCVGILLVVVLVLWKVVLVLKTKPNKIKQS